MFLPFLLNEKTTGPIYQQLYHHVRRAIEQGQLKAGDKLPSKRQLSRELSVSLNTVEAAYEQLRVEGYLQAVQRSGFYVADIKPLSRPAESGQVNAPDIRPAEFPEISSADFWRFDFRTNTVDTQAFPYSTWARLTRRVLQDEQTRLLDMPHPQGDPELRQAIADYLRTYRAVSCLAEQIIVGAGTEYLLNLIIQVIGRDQVIAIENPGYAKTRQILESLSVPYRLIALDDQGMAVSQLEKSDANVVYVTPSHHFPLGLVMPIRRRHQLLTWAQDNPDRYIIEDDYDNEFRFSGRPIPSLQGLDHQGKTVYLGTFSKSIAPSIRISYMVLPPSLLGRYRQRLFFYASTVSLFEQRILAAFMTGGYFERHLNKMRLLYRNRKEKMVQAIQDWSFSDKLTLRGQDAGLHLLLQFPLTADEKVLLDQARQAGIRVYGLSDYFQESGPSDRPPTIILGYAHLDAPALEQAVRELGQAWQSCI